jgi:hypothetical protein
MKIIEKQSQPKPRSVYRKVFGPIPYLDYFAVGSSSIITHIWGFPVFHNWGNAGARILAGTTALKGGYDFSR